MDNGALCYTRFLKGEDEAFAEIIREYKDGLMFYLRGITGSVDTAEELMEETFVRLVTRKPKFRGNSSFKTWLYAIGHNVAVDAIRKNAHIADQAIEDLDLTADDEELENSCIKEEEKKLIHRKLAELNPEYRQVLLLVFFEEMSNEEAALVMHKSRRQIENLLYRAKAALKKKMLEGGYTYEEL